MTRVYWYLRVSGRGQIDGDGPERQRDSIKVFCDANGLSFGGEFFEAAVSGTVEGVDRPAFAEMLQTMECHELNGHDPIKIVVVERMDRLARDLMVSEFLLAECRRAGVVVYSADQGTLIDMASDGGDPTRVLIRQLMGALAQWEKSQLVMKLAKARKRIRLDTGRCEGRLPFGQKPGEKYILEFIRSTIAFDHTISADGAARLLNDAGFKRRLNKSWTPQAANHIVLKIRRGKL